MARNATIKSPWRSAQDRASEREEKQEAVLNAAAAVFAEKGYHGASLDEIASRLGVTKPTLYYYARNKDDLVLAVGERALLHITKAFATDQQSSALSQLQHLLRAYAMEVTTDFGRCIPVIRDARLDRLVSETVRKQLALIDHRLRELLEQGMQDGSIGRCDPKMTAFMIAGAINDIGRWFRPDGDLSASLVAEKFVNQLTSGLAIR